MRRVVITAIGMISPVGVGREASWSALVEGRSGIGPITRFDARSLPVRIGGEVEPFDEAAIMRQFPGVAKTHDRKVMLGLFAAEEAIAESRLTSDELRDALLYVGVGLESIRLEDLTRYAGAEDLGLSLLQASDDESGWIQTPLDFTAMLLGDAYGFRRGRYTNCSACAAGTQVVGQAWEMLRAGESDVALAGATDSMINPLGLGGFSLLQALSEENDRPAEACRPFDATREGTVLGEGAAFLVLETLDHATARGATPYAEILGYGSSLDAHAVSDPDPAGRGAVDSMRRALQTANLSTAEIDCISAHGTGTPKNDVVETAAIKEVFGDHAQDIPVHAIKSMTGHMIAASGAVETAAAALTIDRRAIPPTINLSEPDPACDLDYVPGRSREFTGRTVLSNSFGFGGQNATLILGIAGSEENRTDQRS